MAGSVYRLKPVGAGAEVDVKDGMIVGRNPECDLVLTNGHPSRRHARIDVKADGLWLEDLGSANGTFVNGVQIRAAHKLATGDRVAFDISEFEVIRPPAAVASAGGFSGGLGGTGGASAAARCAVPREGVLVA